MQETKEKQIVILTEAISKRNRFKFEKGKEFYLLKKTPLITQVQDIVTGLKYFLNTSILVTKQSDQN